MPIKHPVRVVQRLASPVKRSDQKQPPLDPNLPIVNPSPRDVLSNLADYTSGIWGDDPRAQEKMRVYLKKDIFSSPAFRESPAHADNLMKIRMDSRGDVMKRAIVGNKDAYRTQKEIEANGGKPLQDDATPGRRLSMR